MSSPHVPQPVIRSELSSLRARLSELESVNADLIRENGARQQTTRQQLDEAWLKTVLSSSLDPMLSIDGRGTMLSASDSVERVFGWKPDQVIGQNINVLMPEPYHSEHYGYLDTYRLTGETNIVGQTRELICQRRDGSTFPCEVTVWQVDVPGSAEPLFTGIIRDITERKKVEEDLRQSETRFRNLIEGSLQGILVHRNHKPLFVNESWGDFLGYTREEVLAMDSVLAMAAPHERVRLAAYYDARIGSDPAPTQYEFQGLRKDGSLAWLDMRPTLVDWDGERAVQLTLMDVTERRRAEDELRERERQYRLVTDNVPARIAYLDTDQRICFANAPVERQFATEQGQIIGKHVREVLGEPAYAVRRDYIERALSGEQVSAEVLVPYPDGQSRWVAMSYVPDVDDFGNVKGVYGLTTDIAERKLAEEKARKHLAELAHVTRLATMGEMVTGLAHELNQPLTAIVNFADACEQMLANDDSPPVEQLSDWVTKIGDQAYRSGQIIKRLRGLVKKTPPRHSTVDVNYVVNEAIDLLGADAWMNEIQLNLDLCPSIPIIFGDYIQIQQVILNLVKNAAEAIADQTDGPREVNLATMATENGVEIAVADTGTGLTVDDSEIIFDAFFTTKGAGMGMGLAISRSIVEAHGGRLWVTANKDRGATFRFTLPITGKRDPAHVE